jgi:hypothetical protein
VSRARETEDERFERIDSLLSRAEWFCAGAVFGVLVLALLLVAFS